MTKKFKIFQPSFFERYLGSFQYIEINKSNVKIYRENSLIRNFFNFKNARSDVLDMLKNMSDNEEIKNITNFINNSERGII